MDPQCFFFPLCVCVEIYERDERDLQNVSVNTSSKLKSKKKQRRLAAPRFLLPFMPGVHSVQIKKKKKSLKINQESSVQGVTPV